MPARKRVPKEKPLMKTVKESWRPSDLLRIEVCQPIKDHIDKVEICKPHITEKIECLPDRICKPFIVCYPDRFCTPDIWCRPRTTCIPDILCKPQISCKPDIFCSPIMVCGPTMYELPEEIPFEMKDVLKELQTIKAEIEELKKSIR